jgi:hypothetical protein
MISPLTLPMERIIYYSLPHTHLVLCKTINRQLVNNFGRYKETVGKMLMGSTLSWYWYRVKIRDLVSVFCMWISSFPSSICWRGCLFFIMCFGLLCWRSVGYRCVGLCLDLLFWSFDLPVCFCVKITLFLLLWLCSIVWSWALWCFQHWTFCSELAIQGPLCFHMYFTTAFSISMQTVIGIL